MKPVAERKADAARIAEKQVLVARIATVGGWYLLYRPDGSDGPYTLLGTFAGDAGWHYFAEFWDYLAGLKAIVAAVADDLRKHAG
jgi:hypothetical protein